MIRIKYFDSLKIATKVDDNCTEITLIKTQPKTGLLKEQLKSLTIPVNSILSRIRVFSSADGEIALNIFTFLNKNSTSNYSSMIKKDTDTNKIFKLINEIKAGLHINNPFMPTFSPLFELNSMNKSAYIVSLI